MQEDLVGLIVESETETIGWLLRKQTHSQHNSPDKRVPKANRCTEDAETDKVSLSLPLAQDGKCIITIPPTTTKPLSFQVFLKD
ncbi:hypothetical protein PPACK8108_LOCUS11426 [Phakopsora pachyrhizi]|uniref:Uncharacterized protein n=1 Tax=Phakopsora pachyrhizi TaxID=170000 RepID=A0AAV0B224_PHAPC|nr:hypothetical protein PPACK8108_LOCUS11426 [Phakopsora pachyrhizi]